MYVKTPTASHQYFQYRKIFSDIILQIFIFLDNILHIISYCVSVLFFWRFYILSISVKMVYENQNCVIYWFVTISSTLTLTEMVMVMSIVQQILPSYQC